VLEHDAQGLSTAFSSRSPISSATRVRAQSTDSAIDGAFFSSSSRAGDRLDQAAGDPVVEVRAPAATTISAPRSAVG
jgi:hypothetical protein